MKLLYMLKKQYSRFCLRELVVIAQIVLMVLLFTPIFSQLDDLLAIDQLANNVQHPAYFFQADDYYFMPEFWGSQEYQDFFDEIEECDAVQELGLTSTAVCTVGEVGVSIYFYNDALLSHLRLKANNYKYEEGIIPVIIDRNLGEKYHLGDLITPNSTVYFPVSAEQQSAQFRVVGIQDDNDNYYYSLVGGASRITLESIGHKDDGFCMIALGSFDIVPMLDVDPSSLLFVEAERAETMAQINTAIGHLGHAESMEVMRQNSLNNILTTNPLPFVTAVLMVLLCLASVCSYAYVSVIRLRENFAIYYIYGLNRKTAISLTMCSLLLLLIISLLTSLVFLSLIIDSSQYNGLSYSICIVVTLFVVSYVLVLTQYGSINPIKLMRKGD